MVFCRLIRAIMCHFQEEDVEMGDENAATETRSVVAEAKATTQTSSVKKVYKLFDTILHPMNIVQQNESMLRGWSRGGHGLLSSWYSLCVKMSYSSHAVINIHTFMISRKPFPECSDLTIDEAIVSQTV